MSKENYQPFSEEWKKEICKMTKSEIIDLAVRVGTQCQQIEQKFKIAESALNNILQWQEDVDEDWDYPETIASNALEKLAKIDGF